MPKNGAIMRGLKIAAVGVAIVGSLFTGFLAHEGRYFTRAEAQDLKKVITKQTSEIKLLVLESRQRELEQRVYELEARRDRSRTVPTLTEADEERLRSFQGELRHLSERVSTLRKQVDAPE